MDNHFESDDALRRVYGEGAIFSRVGPFTLVHLDSPAQAEIERRVAEFDPNEFFFDDCPLCESAKSSGGHVVFDGPEETDPLRDGAPAAAFDRALGELGAAAEDFGTGLGDIVPGPLVERYEADVATLHDRFVETLWAEESEGRVETFERQLARALTTVAEICREAPVLTSRAQPLEEALEGVAAVWRSI